MAKYRLLAGLHTEGSGLDSAALASLEAQLRDGRITQKEFDKQSATLKPRRIYKPGELIESSTDLTKLNGRYPMQGKFAKADDNVAMMNPPPYEMEETRNVPPGEDTLETMTVEELRRTAQMEEIDVSGLHKKPELVAAIRKHMQQLDAATR